MEQLVHGCAALYIDVLKVKNDDPDWTGLPEPPPCWDISHFAARTLRRQTLSESVWWRGLRGQGGLSRKFIAFIHPVICLDSN